MRRKVYPWGAHVTSYKTAEGRELIFLSRDAILDGKNAEFGQPDKSYPQHGFLRNNYWKVVPSSRRYDDRGGATIAFELDLNDVINARGDGKWGPETRLNARCTLSLAFDRDSLTTTITMTNTGDSDWDFQVLLHNYFMVRGHAALDGEQCYVRGLEGYGVSDKVSGEEYMSGGEPVTVPDKLIDRVYTPPAGKAELNLVIGTGDSSTVELTARGNVDGRPVAVSGVVWNPHEEKAKGMSDFGSDQYRDMLCVEPGLLDKHSLEHYTNELKHPTQSTQGLGFSSPAPRAPRRFPIVDQGRSKHELEAIAEEQNFFGRDRPAFLRLTHCLDIKSIPSRVMANDANGDINRLSSLLPTGRGGLITQKKNPDELGPDRKRNTNRRANTRRAYEETPSHPGGVDYAAVRRMDERR
ncbi:hypothetical protein THAOC_17837, partial [Thalassiosira oceanica]